MGREIIPPELDLFAAEDTMMSISDYHYEKVQCRTALSDVDYPAVLELSAPPTKTHYTSLKDSFLVVKCKFIKADGSDLGAAPVISTVQAPLHSLFRSVDMWLNNVKITPPEINQHYISWFEQFLYPEHSQKTYMQLGGWYPDNYSSIAALNQSDPTEKAADKNEGLTQRSLLFGSGRECTLMGKLYSVPHKINRLLPPNVRLDWSLHTNPYELFAMHKAAATKDQYRFVITEASIWLKRVSVNPGAMIAHNNLLATRNMLFPVRYLETRTLDLMRSSFNFRFPNIFTGNKVPLALYALFIETESKQGHLQKNPYTLQHCNLSEIRCSLGSKIVPTIMYKLDPTNYNTEEALANTLLSLEAYGSNTGPAQLTRETFTMGAFVVGFDLTRDSRPLSASYINSNYEASSVHLEGSFSKALDKNITLMVLGVFNGRLELNRFLEPVTTFN